LHELGPVHADKAPRDEPALERVERLLGELLDDVTTNAVYLSSA
jgi:hypothetical protein